MTVDTVGDVPADMTLVTGCREVRHVLQSIGHDTDGRLAGSVFVRTKAGEYSTVYWCQGQVPFLNRPVDRLR